MWQRLTEALAVELAALTAAAPLSSAAAPIIDDVPAAGAVGVSRRGGPRDLAENYLQIAHTGVYDTARYGSPSQARQAVVTAAVWAGMSLVDVLARISDGRWRGL
ncbi:MAG: MarR family transcriptional regulator, partial [Actinomycetota bacterium]|nr:MarR family transcriptional regulator [Actinomycetota bacterium]